MKVMLFLLIAGIASAQQDYQYLTYVGGAGDDSVSMVSSDRQGNTYIAGQTNSIGAPFEDVPGGYMSVSRGYLMKLDPSGHLVFSKVFGFGSITALAADQDGNVFVGGTLLSSPPSDFATEGSYQATVNGPRAFIVKLGPSGEKLFATYFGFNNFVQIRTISLDANGQPVFCGTARGNSVPLTGNAVFQFPATGVGSESFFAYCAQLSADGSRLLFSTLLNGKAGIITPMAAKVDGNGDLIVAGTTESAEIPLVNAFQSEDRRRTLFSAGAEGRFRGIGGARFGTIVSQQQVGKEIFVGTQNEGGWASADAGETWEQVADRGLSGVLAAHPLNTQMLCVANQTLQLVCSRDRGKTWVTAIGSRIRVTGVVADPRAEGGFFVTSSSLLSVNYYSLGTTVPPNPSGPVDWIQISPDGNFILASVNNGMRSLQVSEDAGVSFREIANDVRAAAAAPTNRRRLFASVWARDAATDSAVIRSDDGGVTWMNTALDAPFDSVGQIEVDPFNPDTVYAVAGTGAFRSVDGGTSWQPWMPPGLDNVAVKFIQFDAQGGALVGALGLGNGFVMKLKITEPAVQWSSLFGGAGGAWLGGLSLDADGRIVLGGYTLGGDLPETGEPLGPKQVQSGVVARVGADGRLETVRYLGAAARALDRSGDGSVQIAAVATQASVGASGAAYGKFGGVSDAVWLTLSPELDRVTQVSWLGGSRFDQANAIHAGSDGRIRVAGSTVSRDLPTSPGALQERIAGGAESFFGFDGFLAITPLRF